MYARILCLNGEQLTLPVQMEKKDSLLLATLSREGLPEKIQEIQFLPDFFSAQAGEEGYFVVPGAPAEGTFLTRFTPRENMAYTAEFSHLHCLGMRRAGRATLAIVAGLKLLYSASVRVENGRYTAYPTFKINGGTVYEDIVVEYYDLGDGDYSAMARRYREYQMAREGCVPLSQRVADERLRRAADAPEIRVRQAWKPVPSPVEYQTPETEPPVHAACTFDRIGDILDEMQRQGLRGGEICLVGWNRGGHDGRFPQNFPVEPALGGQAPMECLIDKAKKQGLNIVCHTDNTAAYTIADCWDEEYLVRNVDGSLLKRPYCWGGGRPHKVCPQREYELFDTRDMEQLSALGFTGIHYIDVLTILPVVGCYDPRHPLTPKESEAWYRKSMALCREKIGGFASEGGYDYAADLLDYCMYTAFHVLDRKWNPVFDENIPFWQLVYHGVILYNACTDTLNYAKKGADNRLKFFEYGGRPLIVYYANFAANNNWMGEEDFICDTDAQLKDSVTAMKEMYDDYELMRPERYAYMQSHRQTGAQSFETVYSNGTRVTVDYAAKEARIERGGETHVVKA